MLLAMEKPLDCPFCASDDLAVTEVEQDCRMLAVLCNECGAQGPLSLGNDRTQAIHSWNQRWSEPPAGKGLPGFRPLKLGAATLDSVSVRLVCEAAKLRCGLTCRQLHYFRAVACSDQRFFVPRH